MVILMSVPLLFIALTSPLLVFRLYFCLLVSGLSGSMNYDEASDDDEEEEVEEDHTLSLSPNTESNRPASASSTKSSTVRIQFLLFYAVIFPTGCTQIWYCIICPRKSHICG